MGNGKKIKFWEDTWCGSEPFCETFLDLYRIVGTKGTKATDVWVVQGELGTWDPKFLRPFNDWELNSIQVFIGLTSNRVITPLAKDILIWKGDASGCFTIKAYFNQLEGVSHCSNPTKMLWNPYVPSKISFFAWEAWCGKVLTFSQL